MGDEMRNGYFLFFFVFLFHQGTTPGVPLLFFFFTFESGFGHESGRG